MNTSEEKNEMLSVMINICTRVVTMIFVIVTLFTLISGNVNELHFSFKDICGVLFMGLVAGIAVGIFFIKKNMDAKQTIIIHIIYFLILNFVLLFIGLSLGWFKKEASSLVIMELMFIMVYFVVSLLVYLFDFNEAKKINKKLKERKQS